MDWPRMLVGGWVMQAAFVVSQYQKEYKAALVGKAGAAMCFIFLALTFSPLCSEPAYARLVALGLGAGMCGDVLLAARYIFAGARRPLFIAGAAFFFAGQLLYIFALAGLAPRALLLGLPVLAVGLAAELFITRREGLELGRLMIPGALYLASVVYMAGCAMGAAVLLKTPAMAMFFGGGACFAVSDTILAVQEFSPEKRRWRGAVLLALYYAAQTAIALTIKYV